MEPYTAVGFILLFTSLNRGSARFKKDGKLYDLKKCSKKRLGQESITIPSKHWECKSGDWAFLKAIKERTKECSRTERN